MLLEVARMLCGIEAVAHRSSMCINICIVKTDFTHDSAKSKCPLLTRFKCPLFIATAVDN